MFQFLIGLCIGSEISKKDMRRSQKPDIALRLAILIIIVILCACFYIGNGLLGTTKAFMIVVGLLLIVSIIFFAIMQPKAVLPLIGLLVLLIGSYQIISPMIQDLEAVKVENDNTGNKNLIANLL